MEKLLEKVAFNKASDHLIFTGDMINKGPASLDVVDLARGNVASCVRGNHEDRILLLRRSMLAAGDNGIEGVKKTKGEGKTYTRDQSLARQLNKEQAEWLEQCPVILDVGQLNDMGHVVVVHGGLVPGVENERQDPLSSMTMRTIDLDNHFPNSSSKGVPWSKVGFHAFMLLMISGRSLICYSYQLFNKYQSLLYDNLTRNSVKNPKAGVTTVIYGHDPSPNPKLRTYTKGIDTGCVKGGKLTAFLIEDGGRQSIEQVKCHNYKKHADEANLGTVGIAHP